MQYQWDTFIIDAKFDATADQINSAYREEKLLQEHKPNETLIFS